jgi:hypothetical protein
MQFNTKSTKENANTKDTKSIFLVFFVLNFACFVLTCISLL